MPRFDLTAAQQEDALAFLAWMQKNKPAIKAVFRATEPGGDDWLAQLPWFEYR